MLVSDNDKLPIKHKTVCIRFRLLKPPSVVSNLPPYSRRNELLIFEIANSVDLDEVAHNEPPHLDLHCLPSSR